MSTYRIYVDSRERQDPTNSTNEDFELALPFSISIVETSLAMIDVVCVPNSILIVTFNKLDTILAERDHKLWSVSHSLCQNRTGVLHSPDIKGSDSRGIQFWDIFVWQLHCWL